MNTFRQSTHTISVGTAMKVSAILAVILALNFAGGWIASQANIQIWPEHMPIIEMMWIGMLLTYAVLMMLPFVPGIEIGLVLMMMLGDGGVVLVYLATQVALSTSFLAGRCLSASTLARGLAFLGLVKAAGLLNQAQQASCDQRSALLSQRLDRGLGKWLLAHRNCALAALINLPGNAVLGGAGGIGLLAGSSGLFCYGRYVLTMALATAPVPVLVVAFGLGR